MIKKYIRILFLVALLVSTTGCQLNQKTETVAVSNEEINSVSESVTTTDTINEVLDEHYDAFVGDVYSHPKDYEGLKYRLRAYYRQVEHDGLLRNYLFKGTDERWMGFEIETTQKLPEPGSMILIEGTFKIKNDEGQDTPYLEIESLEIIREK